MHRFLLIALCALSLTGCKIVYDDETDAGAIPDGPEGDDARNAALVAASFEPDLLPLIQERALSLAALRDALAGGLDAAGAAHANRGAGQGAAWNFALTDSGTIIAANTTSSARTADVDVDGDGGADLRVQLGPVIRGTALRDAAPFYKFDDFRDQIEFAKLARALNDEIRPRLSVPEGDLLGQRLSFSGIVPLKSAGEALVLTPVEIAFAP